MRTAAALTVLGAASLAATAAGAVSFSQDVVPILRTNCATCHLTGQEPGNMKLHPGGAYASLVNVPSTESGLMRIKPGQPEASYLMHKLDGTHLDAGGQGERMPFGASPLDESVRDLIRAWIKGGARKN